jgi:hypothetical protein
MVIPDREKFFHPFIHPLQFIFLLTGRAMTVAATVVCLYGITAMVARFEMAAKA